MRFSIVFAAVFAIATTPALAGDKILGEAAATSDLLVSLPAVRAPAPNGDGAREHMSCPRAAIVLACRANADDAPFRLLAPPRAASAFAGTALEPARPNDLAAAD